MSLGKLQKGYFSSARKIFFHLTVIVGHKESTQSIEKAFKRIAFTAEEIVKWKRKQPYSSDLRQYLKQQSFL